MFIAVLILVASLAPLFAALWLVERFRRREPEPDPVRLREWREAVERMRFSKRRA